MSVPKKEKTVPSQIPPLVTTLNVVTQYVAATAANVTALVEPTFNDAVVKLGSPREDDLECINP